MGLAERLDPASDAASIDPFGYWPSRTSAVAGLHGDGVEAGDDPAHAFHSAYLLLETGPTRVTVTFHGLRASRGKLCIRIHAQPFDGGRTRLVRKLMLPLARLARTGGTATLTFAARAEHFHAVVGRIVDGNDASATALDLRVEPGPVEASNRQAMLRARRAVFARGSLVERRPWRRSPVDRLGLVSPSPATIADPASQLCTERQIDEPAYAAWLTELGEVQRRHRKQWEIIYALAVLRAHGMIAPGRRGIGFGCGTEWLPAYLAGHGCAVLATDMPDDHRDFAAWRDTGQHSHVREPLFFPHFVERAAFDRLIRYRPVDMNDVPADLSGFDFSWSLCAFEHLGSIRQGLDFIHAAVACLRPGGVAVHTTEFNLLSDTHTIDHTSTVLFRRRDMEQLALELTRAGHRVLPLRFDPEDDWRDDHIDVPPFRESPHLKLALRQYVTTSFGIAVVRGG